VNHAQAQDFAEAAQMDFIGTQHLVYANANSQHTKNTFIPISV